MVAKGAEIKLSKTAKMPRKGGFVVGILGSSSDPIKDVTVVLNGTIDGNKAAHPYESSGNEGIRVDYGERIVIFGNGVVQNASGDGVDFDATKNSLVAGITIRENDGAGMHFGTPRPITSSRNNQVIGIETYGNGWVHSRSGADVSWPNQNAATYVWVSSFSNYQNWDLAGYGSKAIRSYSGQGDKSDYLAGTTLSEINDELELSHWPNSGYVFQLMKRDLRTLLGYRDVPDYLRELNYWR